MGCCLSNEKPEIVTLCGSTKFRHYFHIKNAEFTKQNIIVLAPGVFDHAEGSQLTIEEKNKLDILHKKKIAMLTYVYIINIGRYIGKSTQREIEYAHTLSIPVYYHE